MIRHRTAMICGILVFAAIAAEARFCEQVAVTGGRLTRGDQAAINAADGQLLEVVSQRTNSRLVQMADIAMLFRIPEAVSLIDVAGMQITITAHASMPQILVMTEAWDYKQKKWIALDSLRLALISEQTDVGIKNAKRFINPKTRLFRLRFRTKKETRDPYYLKLDNVHLVGIKKEGLKDYGDLFAVELDDKPRGEFEKKLKKLKEDWDLSFNKGGRIIPIKDWETTEERKEKMKADWRQSWNKNGNLISFESQMK